MIDLHTHTDRSDGTASPAQLVDDAKAMGLEALGITDHDTLEGYDTAAPLAAAVISCKSRPRRDSGSGFAATRRAAASATAS